MGSAASTKKNKIDKHEEERKALLRQRKVTCDILEKLARSLPKISNPLGQTLHIPSESTVTLEWEANMHYLQSWKKWKKDEATIGALIDLLKKAGHKDDAVECLFNISKEPKNASTVTENREEVVLPPPSRIGTTSHVYRGSLEGSSRSFLCHDLLPDHKINQNNVTIAEQSSPTHSIPQPPFSNNHASFSNSQHAFSPAQPQFFNTLQESIHGNQQGQGQVEQFSSLHSRNEAQQNTTVQNHRSYEYSNHIWRDFRDMQNVTLAMQYAVGSGPDNDYFPGIAVTRQGEIILSNNKKNSLCKIDGSGQCRTLIQCGDLSPAGLCCTANNTIAVCCGESVSLFDTNGYSMGNFGKNNLKWSRGICVDQNGRFIVSDILENTVTIFSSNGQAINKLKTPKNLAFNKPYYVTTNDHNQIVVSDSKNHCIKLFDQNGNYLRKFGSFGSKVNELKQPLCVVTDCCNNMMVADFGNTRLSLYSSGGWFLKEVMNQNTHKINKPTAMCMYNNNEMILTTLGSTTVDKYSLNIALQ